MNTKEKVEMLLNGGLAPQLSTDALCGLNRIAFHEAEFELSNRAWELTHPEGGKLEDPELKGFLEDADEQKYLD